MSKAAARSPVFVVGTPRSGTTLTAEILGRHPELLMPGELHYFQDIYARRRELGNLSEPASRGAAVDRLLTLYGRYNQPDQQRIDRLFADAALVDRLRGSARSHRELLCSFMSMQMEAAGKTRWGNNTPKDIFQIDDILHLIPDARFVICVRDIRDFMLSYKGRWKVSAHADRLNALYHPVLTAMLWRATARVIPDAAARLGPDRCRVVKYEDLVTNPASVVQDLCAMLGLGYEDQMLQVEGNNSSSAPGGPGIFTSSIGAWRDALSAEEVYIAERVAGREMERLGYQASHPSVSARRVAGHLATLPVATARALWANRHHRGPTLPYLGRRLGLLLR